MMTKPQLMLLSGDAGTNGGSQRLPTE